MSIELDYDPVADIAFQTSHGQYFPNAETENDLRDRGVTLVAVVGPMLVGKTSVMEQVEEIDGGFTIARGFTSRPRWSGEAPDAYEFVDHSPEELAHIAKRVRARDYVQCVLHPNGYVYGTEVDDYEPPFALHAPISSEVEKLEALPFDDTFSISLVTPMEDYIGRLRRHAAEPGVTDDHLLRRLDQAEVSLTWSLDQGDKVAWVANADGLLVNAAAEVIRIVRGGQDPNRRTRELGARMLRGISDLREFL